MAAPPDSHAGVSAMNDPSPIAVLPSARAWPLYDVDSSRQIEAQALAATEAHALMARAGLATARLAAAIAPYARRLWVAAGPGNNGGDALVAAAHLHRWGRDVHVTFLGVSERLPDDARWALSLAQAAGVPVATELPASIDADLCIDGLLGLGVRQAPRGAVAEAVRRLNAQAAPVLAIDLPSGLDADTGVAHGALAVRAAHTLALLTLKTGLFTADGRDHAGRVWIDSLGVDANSTTASAHLAGPPPAAERRHAQHKGSFGDVVVLGGAPGMGGAALLAARAALTAGAGRVLLARLDRDGALLEPDAPRPELMPRQPAEVLQSALLSASTVVCGCGGGQAIAALLPAVLDHSQRLLLDADALNAIATDAGLAQRLRQRNAATVLTPHPLEAARLLGTSAAAVQADRPAHARRLARETGATVLLKGSGTLIATPDGNLSVNPTGNARLGTAGSGDVLAGWIGGRWSQAAHVDPSGVQSAIDSAWCHGRAAESGARSLPLRAADLIDAMAEVGITA